MIIKHNQPTLYWAAQLVFAQPPQPRLAGEWHYDRSYDKTHGRLERRTLIATTALNDDLQWPGVAQMLCRHCRCIHERTGQVTTETSYGLTSLANVVSAAQLERIWRGHWTMENRLHYVRDETLGEDRCLVHTGAAARALAALRNAVLSTLRFHGWSNIAAATRTCAAHPQRALRLFDAITQ